MQMYPIYLRRLDERKTVIVGGDDEAEGKVRQMLDRNANLTVISAELTENLQRWAAEQRFRWIERGYRHGDLEGAFMAIVAEYDGDLNERVYREAVERDILVNVMDDLPHANFAFGSIVRRGPLTISISTSGAAPALAVRLRERFEQEFGPEYERFLTFMQRLRGPMAKHHPDFGERKKMWYALIDSRVIGHFRDNNLLAAYERTAEIVGRKTVNEALGLDNAPKED